MYAGFAVCWTASSTGSIWQCITRSRLHECTKIKLVKDRQMNTQTDEMFDRYKDPLKIHRPESCIVVIHLGPTAGFAESARAFQLPGLSERVTYRVCQSVSSAGPARLFHLIDLHIQTNLI